MPGHDWPPAGMLLLDILAPAVSTLSSSSPCPPLACVAPLSLATCLSWPAEGSCLSFPHSHSVTQPSRQEKYFPSDSYPKGEGVSPLHFHTQAFLSELLVPHAALEQYILPLCSPSTGFGATRQGLTTLHLLLACQACPPLGPGALMISYQHKGAIAGE